MAIDTTHCVNEDCPLAKDCERAAPINGKHDSMARFAYYHDKEGQTVCHNFSQRRIR